MSLLFACITVLFLIIGSAVGQSSYDCSEVADNFIPCVTYLVELESRPADRCCSGLQVLNQMAKINDKGPRNICQCIEDLAYTMNAPYVASRIQSLSRECHIHFSFPISIAMDCYRI
ncbi:protein ARABIDOPSIS THALIANA ANTHER 7 [Gossypium raimondii]|uniref:Bifunctional inhibitor/plant lipid transfer protein/seed storage helical domain-containing protein n=1 Tax=Gossypium raimondii TaxID=29730 RepID=A0A0D2NGZ0_GOSRA|nr:protein ARABIDOPSIS THALIANA ANTHER 7 [Gossypium raimondii]KJB12468.1 hypothetical protein B456_002G020000 [Gossypium raimondii]